MKKFFALMALSFMTAASPLSSMAQTKCVVNMVDGSKKSGYFIEKKKVDRAKTFPFSTEPKGKLEKIDMVEIKSVYFPDTKKTQYAVYYDSKLLPAKEPSMSKAPELFYILYTGKNITIYARDVVKKENNMGNSFGSMGVKISLGSNKYTQNEYWVSIKGQDIARPYYLEVDKPGHSEMLGLKMGLKKIFHNYQKVLDYIDSDDFNTKAFHKDPVGGMKQLEKLMK